MNRFYVYCIFRPWNGLPCYIGKGTGDRVRRHFYKNGKDHYNLHLRSVIEKGGGTLPYIKVAENLLEMEAIFIEAFLIKLIGRSDNNCGPLCNQTDGGGGSSGRKMSQKNKDILFTIHKGSKRTQDHIERLKIGRAGRIFTDATRKKMSDAHKGKKPSQACLDASRKACLGKRPEKAIEAARQKNIGNSYHKGFKHSPETIEKLRISALRQHRGHQD